MQNKLFVYAALVLAVLLPLLVGGKARLDLGQAPVVRFDIEPYDPRDLLYGHYMQFQFKWNWKNIEEAGSQCTDYKNCCLCVGEGDYNPPVSVMNCNQARAGQQCKYAIKGKSYGSNQFDSGLNRFYVDERYALPLEGIFRGGKEKFSVGLFVRDGAKPVLEKLYVGDKNLKDYVDAHGGVIPEPPADAEEGTQSFPPQPNTAAPVPAAP